KGVEQSNKVALNLQLDEKVKRVWFGNGQVAGGVNRFYEVKANLMNFGKKNKYYFLTSMNNIGKNATGEVNDLIYSFHYGEPGHIGDNEQAKKLMALSTSSPGLNRNRVNFNNDRLLSLNAIFNPNEKFKIK